MTNTKTTALAVARERYTCADCGAIHAYASPISEMERCECGGRLHKHPARSAAITRSAQRITLPEATSLGRVFFQSGRFKDQRSEAQAIVQILAGAELGIGPMAAMQSIYMVDGKPTFSANLVATQIKRSGKYDYRVRVLDATECRIEFFQNGEPCGTSSFTIEEAKAAKLTGKDVWAKYPRNMLFSRAMTNGARWFCADVFMGVPVYTPEEVGAEVTIGDDGEMRVVAPPEPTRTDALAITGFADPFAGDEVPSAAKLVQMHDALGKPDGSLGAFLEVRNLVPGLAERKPPALTADERVAARALMRELRDELAEATTPREDVEDAVLVDEANAALSAATPRAEGEPHAGPPTPEMLVGAPKVHDATRKALFALLNEAGMKDRDDRLHWAHEEGVDVASFADLLEPQALWLCKRAEALSE